MFWNALKYLLKYSSVFSENNFPRSFKYFALASRFPSTSQILTLTSLANIISTKNSQKYHNYLTATFVYPSPRGLCEPQIRLSRCIKYTMKKKKLVDYENSSRNKSSLRTFWKPIKINLNMQRALGCKPCIIPRFKTVSRQVVIICYL